MSFLKSFGLFWYRFLIGDDWAGALVILCGLAAARVLVRVGVDAFWLPPSAILLSVSLSLSKLSRSIRNQREREAAGNGEAGPDRGRAGP